MCVAHEHGGDKSGGTKEKRVEAMEAYINLSCYCDSAVLILHANDYELEKTIEQKYGDTGRRL